MGDVDWSAMRKRLLHELRRRGIGSWRLSDDLVDTTLDFVVTRVLSGNREFEMEECLAVSLKTLRTLLVRGPDRVELSRDRVGCLDLVATADLGLMGRRCDFPATARDMVIDLLAADCARLTLAEKRAIDATWGASSIAEAADLAGMSTRDYRVRRNRAVKKIRNTIDDSGPPPHLTVWQTGCLSG